MGKRGPWLTQVSTAFDSQCCEFKPHVWYGAYVKKKVGTKKKHRIVGDFKSLVKVRKRDLAMATNFDVRGFYVVLFNSLVQNHEMQAVEFVQC